MPHALDADAVRRLRLRAQSLAEPRPATVPDVLRRVGALQAQDLAASQLALRARGANLTVGAVVRACNDECAVVRTWLMRGTLHMVAAEDVRWLLRLLGPTFLAADRRRRLDLGLGDDLCARALPLLTEILTGGRALERAALVSALAERGLSIDPKTQAPAHLVTYAALSGLICRGPDHANGEPTYALLDEWIDPSRAHEPLDDLAALARLYLTAHGPATAADLAAWSGLPLRLAAQAIERIANDLIETRIENERAWLLASADLTPASAPPTLRLVPAFDAYLLGYRRRDLALDPTFAKRVNAGGGWVHPTLLLDGRVIATWKLSRQKSTATVTVRPFEPLDPAYLFALESEATEIGHFLGAPATLTLEP